MNGAPPTDANTARPSVSVVVPTRDRPGRLAGLIAALDRQTLDPGSFEVIVIDDASAQRAETTLAGQRDGARTRVISNDVAVGPAAARNQGWRAAQSPLIAFTDDDCEPDPEWLERLLAAHRLAPDAILQGRTGPIAGELDRLGPFGRTKVIDRPTIYYQTCNIAYPRELLERLAGFDETFPEPAGEDADLGWRAREAGAERIFVAEAIVAHAVEDVGLRGYLRDARRGPTSMEAMRRHPGLRSKALYRRHFWHRNHALALLALAGLLVGLAGLLAGSDAVTVPAVIAGLILIAPWLRTLAGRTGAVGGHFWQLPAHAAFDLVEIAACVRNAARTRVLIV